MRRVRIIEHEGSRVETGAVRFGDRDAPGFFIRGDDCYRLMQILNKIDQGIELDDDELFDLRYLSETIGESILARH